MPLNETITQTLNALTPTEIAWYLKILILLGAWHVLNRIMTATISIVQLSVYAYATLKFAYDKWIKKRTALVVSDGQANS